jgi:hypothetical protein
LATSSDIVNNHSSKQGQVLLIYPNYLTSVSNHIVSDDLNYREYYYLLDLVMVSNLINFDTYSENGSNITAAARTTGFRHGHYCFIMGKKGFNFSSVIIITLVVIIVGNAME